MGRNRHGIEQVRYVVDWIRGFGMLVFFGVIAVVAVHTGGWQGWLFGGVLLALVVLVGVWWWVRRDVT